MSDMLKLMETTCKTSIRKVVVSAILLIPAQVLLLMLYPQCDCFFIVVLPFLVIFMLLNIHHVKRCKQTFTIQIPMNQTKSRIQHSILSEWLFTTASYCFLIIMQYGSWMLIYFLVKDQFSIQSNSFYFFSLSQMWLQQLMVYQFKDLLMIILIIGMAGLYFTFLHLSIALKNYRGLASLLCVIYCIAVSALALASQGVGPLLIIITVLAIFAYVELYDLLNIRGRSGSYEEDN